MDPNNNNDEREKRLQQEVNLLKKQLAEKTMSIKKMIKEKQELTVQYEAEKKKCCKHCSEQKKELTRVRSHLTRTRVDIKQGLTTIEKHKKDNEKLKSEIELMKKQLDEQNSNHGKKNNEIVLKSKVIELKEKSLKEKDMVIELKDKKLSEKDDEIVVLKQVELDLHRVIDDLKEDIHSIQTRNKTLELQRDKYKQEVDNFQMRLQHELRTVEDKHKSEKEHAVQEASNKSREDTIQLIMSNGRRVQPRKNFLMNGFNKKRDVGGGFNFNRGKK